MGFHLCPNEGAGALSAATRWQQKLGTGGSKSLAQAAAAWAASQRSSSSTWHKQQHGSNQQNGLPPQVCPHRLLSRAALHLPSAS